MKATQPSKISICTWFVDDDDKEAAFSPQLGRLNSDPKAKAIYWRCVCLFYATSVVHNPEAEHLFFSNTADIPTLDGFDVRNFLISLNVKIVTIPLTYKLLGTGLNSWGNQFYVVDILKYVSEYGSNDQYIILDSDCIWTRNAAPIQDAIAKYGVITYDMHTHFYQDVERIINGRRQRQLAQFHKRMTGKDVAFIPYSGGEIIAGSKAGLAALMPRTEIYWNEMLEKNCSNGPLEEAHLLSCVYSDEGIAHGTGNAFIKRLWTTFKVNNVSIQDRDLIIWHVPAEKDTGLSRAFHVLARTSTPEKPLGHLAEFSSMDWGSYLGIPKRSVSKAIRDRASKVFKRLERL